MFGVPNPNPDTHNPLSHQPLALVCRRLFVSTIFLIFVFTVQPPLFATSDPPFLELRLVSALLEHFAVSYLLFGDSDSSRPFWNALRNAFRNRPARGQNLAVLGWISGASC
jgi:hypothetical protein